MMRTCTAFSRKHPVLAAAILDWTAVCLVLVGVAVINLAFEPFQRIILPGQLPTISFPNQSDTVTVTALFCIAVLAPAFFFITGYYFFRNKRDVHQALLCLGISISLTMIITDFCKNLFGRPRPDFFYRCYPDGISTYDLPFNLNCTGNVDIINEGRKSWPSGHSSVSAAGMALLSLWLAGKIRLFDGRYNLWKVVPCAIPLFVAAYVALSRTQDYKHFWTDALSGFALGCFVSFITYICHYPPLTSPNSGLPLWTRFEAAREASLPHTYSANPPEIHVIPNTPLPSSSVLSYPDDPLASPRSTEKLLFQKPMYGTDSTTSL